MEFEGRKLRTGTVDELRQAKAEHVQDRIVYGSKDQKSKSAASSGLMPPPTAVRRPVLGGKHGSRRGLGFKPTSKSVQNGTEPNGDAGATTKKSNADFKAMFLAGKGETKEEAKEEAKGENEK
ncbi:hypothetical protein NM208_g7537 [Fusarium decemcellulare]|uniref:Uncharacterized protein n=1 Tax=Fusarium decemcellulare TaxID=57161 RepID=A0ACC1S989_9HYPO|nr:hypothetical protein NM208_g7537 [Fusarium decemcellulare]